MCIISLIREHALAYTKRPRSGIRVVESGRVIETREHHGKIELSTSTPCPPGADPASPLVSPAEPKARGGGAGPGAQESILLPELPCPQVVCPHRAPGPQNQLNTIISVSLFDPEPSKFRIVLNMFQMEYLFILQLNGPFQPILKGGL